MTAVTAVNDRITDAVTQSNVQVVADGPALAMASVYQTMAHSTGILLQNSVAATQQQNTLSQAATNQGVMQVYSLDTTAAAASTQKIGQTGTPDSMASFLGLIAAFQQPQS
ncbi:RebB family R body protein [Neogemmobacter tilapiae]|uniref:RebB protein n=1 Tax=Neogemmobacter tilapiae TaxID=875041 RepID=A0A918TWX0_9RHOB|nr:RebB family R body protein [Gemmobacter tilapiae]GHC64710.1 RebB protein [Gemmobacter tilapiae]